MYAYVCRVLGLNQALTTPLQETSDGGTTALHLAAAFGNDAMVWFLVNAAGKNGAEGTKRLLEAKSVFGSFSHPVRCDCDIRGDQVRYFRCLRAVRRNI